MEYSEEELLAKFSNTAYDWMKAYFDRADIESWKCSGKMSFIADLAQNCNVMNEKLVIVSHSLACLDYIEQLLPIFGIKSLKISGATVGLKRQEIIDKFQNDASYGVILLSAKVKQCLLLGHNLKRFLGCCYWYQLDCCESNCVG